MAEEILACGEVVESISALADGEASVLDRTAIGLHLGGCSECRVFAESIPDRERGFVVDSAPTMPDLGPSIASRSARAERRQGWGVTRLALALVAVSVVALSLPALFLGEDGAAPSHEARHLGAFSMAYGIGLMVIVYRPSRARAFLLVTMLLATSLIITAIFDVAQGNIPLSGEVIHVPEVASLVLVWLLARQRPGSHLGETDRADPAIVALRLIDEPGDEDRTG